jgi:hypothetical protein
VSVRPLVVDLGRDYRGGQHQALLLLKGLLSLGHAPELEEVFRLKSERSISNDWVVRYDNRFFQLQAQSRNYAPAKGEVVV